MRRLLVSVVLPAYNVAPYVEQAVTSVLRQSYQDWELLVADDMSSDETRAILDSYQDPRVLRFHNERRLGYLKTCNKLFEHCRGDFITFQDADDWSAEDRLARLVAAFDANPELVLCGSALAIVDKGGRRIAGRPYPETHAEILKAMPTGNPFAGAALMVRAEVARRIGGYREAFDGFSHQDYDWSSRIAEAEPSANLPQELYFYRQHDTSNSRQVTIKRATGLRLAQGLARQRQETGMDALQRGDMAAFEALAREIARPYEEDPALLYREFAGGLLWGRRFKLALSASLTAIRKSPGRAINYRTFFYCLRTVLLQTLRPNRTALRTGPEIGMPAGPRAVTASGASTEPKTRRLRVAVLVDRLEQPAWIQGVMRELTTSSVSQLVAVIRNERPTVPAQFGRAWGHMLYDAYTRRDRLPAFERDALAESSLEPVMRGVPVIDIQASCGPNSQSLEAEDVAELTRLDLDVLICLAPCALHGKILDVPRFGVWTFRHGDTHHQRHGPPGFWEVMEGRPTTSCVLERLAADPGAGSIIGRYVGRTHFDSVRVNINSVCWASVPLLKRALSALHETRALPIEAANADEPLPRRRPGAFEMLPLLARRTARRARQWLRYRLFEESDEWFVAVARQANGSIEDALASCRPLEPPAGRFWADPFPVAFEKGHVIFVEEFLARERRGRIAALVIDAEGRAEPARPVLEREHHLSYPFVFQQNGEHFMVPETVDVERVELYRARRFPEDWVLESVLLDHVRAADVTIHEAAGLYWMFFSEGSPAHAELHVYWAEGLLGRWRPHCRNPVKMDVRSARPAGRLFTRDGVLYRPAQDCSLGYGYAITLNRVDRLDTEAYRETPVAHVAPDWAPGLAGTHTLNFAGSLMVVDGLRRRRHFRPWFLRGDRGQRRA